MRKKTEFFVSGVEDVGEGPSAATVRLGLTMCIEYPEFSQDNSDPWTRFAAKQFLVAIIR